MHVSCSADEGISSLKAAACDALLAHRVESKLKGTKINSVINRIHVALPRPRDDLVREAFIPEAVRERRMYDREDPRRRRLERDLEAEEGGAGVYNVNLKSRCLSPLLSSPLPILLELSIHTHRPLVLLYFTFIIRQRTTS